MDDKAGTVEIKLTQPQSDFLYILTTFFAAIVPSSTPQKDTENPPPAAAGPYYISQYKPSRSFTVLRNPHYTADPGHPDRKPGQDHRDHDQRSRAVGPVHPVGPVRLRREPLPTDRLKQLQQKYGDQIKLWRTPSTYYFFMNQRTPPFDNLKARQAVNYAINRQTLVNLRGGLGVPTENFLPPTYPQYKKITPPAYPYDLVEGEAARPAVGDARA